MTQQSREARAPPLPWSIPVLWCLPNPVNTLNESWLRVLLFVLSSGKAFYFPEMKEPIYALLWTI